MKSVPLPIRTKKQLAIEAEELIRSFYGRSVSRISVIEVGASLSILELAPDTPLRIGSPGAVLTKTNRLHHQLRFDDRIGWCCVSTEGSRASPARRVVQLGHSRLARKVEKYMDGTDTRRVSLLTSPALGLRALLVEDPAQIIPLARAPGVCLRTGHTYDWEVFLSRLGTCRCHGGLLLAK